MAKTFYTASDLAPIINRSENYCYCLIRKLNKELEEQGYITVKARIPVKYFEKRVCAGGDLGVEDGKH